MAAGAAGKAVGHERSLLVEGAHYCAGSFSLNDSLACQPGTALPAGMADPLSLRGEGHETGAERSITRASPSATTHGNGHAGDPWLMSRSFTVLYSLVRLLA